MIATHPLPTLDSIPESAWRVAGITAAALAGLAVLGFLWRWYRHFRQQRRLHALVTSGAYEHLRDVLVPDGQGGWYYMDYLLLTARGVIVLDLRRIAGNIFGGDQMNEWTVMHGNRRQTFANPQSALFDRMAAVRSLTQELPVDGRIVFTAPASFPKGLPRHTLLIGSLGSEFPPVDRQALSQLLQGWQPEWQRIAAAVMTGAQARRKLSG